MHRLTVGTDHYLAVISHLRLIRIRRITYTSEIKSNIIKHIEWVSENIICYRKTCLSTEETINLYKRILTTDTSLKTTKHVFLHVKQAIYVM